MLFFNSNDKSACSSRLELRPSANHWNNKSTLVALEIQQIHLECTLQFARKVTWPVLWSTNCATVPKTLVFDSDLTSICAIVPEVLKRLKKNCWPSGSTHRISVLDWSICFWVASPTSSWFSELPTNWEGMVIVTLSGTAAGAADADAEASWESIGWIEWDSITQVKLNTIW